MTPDRRGEAPRHGTAVAALCLVAFALTVWLSTRHNTFPFYYHPDEPGKTRQLLGGERNYRHPLLMLDTTQLVLDFLSDDPTRQEAVVVGRWVSAAFAGLAVVCLVALGYQQVGWFGAVAVALLTALCPPLIDHAHYLKEDTALMAGVATALLAADLYARAPSRGLAILLGAACGVALSAKYTGVAMLVAAIRGGSVPRRAFLWVLAGCAATTGAINLRAMSELSALWQGFAYEGHHTFTGGSFRATQPVWSDKYWELISGAALNPVLRALAVGFIGYVAVTWRQRSAGERLMALFPIGFLLFMQLFPLKAARYLLPVLVSASALAALAIARLSAGAPWRRVLAVALLVFVAAWEGWAVHTHLSRFEHDSREQLRAYVAGQLPATATIAQDRYGGLPDVSIGHLVETDPRLTQQVRGVRSGDVFKLGTVAELRAAGVTHVVVSDRHMGQYRNAIASYPSSQVEARYARGRAFLDDLQRDGTLVWSAPGSWDSPGVPVDPELKLYALAPPDVPHR